MKAVSPQALSQLKQVVGTIWYSVFFFRGQLLESYSTQLSHLSGGGKFSYISATCSSVNCLMS